MNWIKTNNLMHISKVAFVAFAMMTVISVIDVYGDTGNFSGGKPYYANVQGGSGSKWFSLFCNWTNNTWATANRTVENCYDVYGPCELSNCTLMVQMGNNYYTQFHINFYYNSTYYSSENHDKDESGVNWDGNWQWYPNTTYPNALQIKQQNIYKIGVKCTDASYSLTTGTSGKLWYNNIQIALAPHLLLEDGTKCGTTNLTIDKTSDTAAAPLGQSKLIKIPLRSFLTKGSITIKMLSGDPTVFRVNNSKTDCTKTRAWTVLSGDGLTEKCGIYGGTGSSFVGSSTNHNPGKTDDLILVYYYPTSTSEQTATFIITDGTFTDTATIIAKGVQKQVDLYPQGTSYTPGTVTVTSEGNGKPYYASDNKWYSIYRGNNNLLLYKRTITSLAVFPPCDGDLNIKFVQYCNEKNECQTPSSTEGQRKGSDYSLFAVGFNRMMKYKSADLGNDGKNDNDGVKYFVEGWKGDNAFGVQTITFDNYTSYKDSLHTIQIYNASGAHVNLNETKLLLATHVLIDDNTVFGTDDFNISCNKDDNLVDRSAIYVGDTQTNTFKLRSFLSTNNLRMKIVNKTDHSTQNTNFKIVKWGSDDVNNYQYEVQNTANVCGYMGADNSSAGSPINTSNLEIKIAFCPQSAGDNLEADLVFYDVVNNVETEFATVHLTGTATAGTLTFDDNNGSGDGNWFTASNWKTGSGSTSTKYPGNADDVQIAADCTIPNDSIAVAKAVTINGGVLTVEENAVLNATSIQNTDATKLLLKADLNHSASVLFNSGVVSNSPRATVQCYFKGVPYRKLQQNSKDNSKIDTIITPRWQYRGFIGSPDANGWSTKDVLVYEWDESKKGWITDSLVTKGKSWTGYSMGRTDTVGATKTYTTTLIPTNVPETLSLANTATGKGLNLKTNSFSVPVRIESIDFGSNVERQIVFFKTNTYGAVDSASASRKKLDNVDSSLYVTLPVYSGGAVTGKSYIPAGQSFFCFTSDGTSNNKLILPAPSSDENVGASGEMYAPRKHEEFNVLTIYAESDSEIDQVYLVESDNCTHNYDDGYDGTKYFTDGMGQIYGKNDFGRTFIAADSSMLGQMIGFKAGSNDMTYTLRFDTERLTGYDELYLYDRVTKRYVNILEGGTYSFTGSTDGEDERFQVIGRMEDSDSFITGSDHALEVVADRALLKGFDGEDEVVYMTDLTGKVVWSDNAKNGPWFELPTDIALGLYIIHCGDVTAKYLKR